MLHTRTAVSCKLPSEANTLVSSVYVAKVTPLEHFNISLIYIMISNVAEITPPRGTQNFSFTSESTFLNLTCCFRQLK